MGMDNERTCLVIALISVVSVLAIIYVKVAYFSDVFAEEVIVDVPQDTMIYDEPAPETHEPVLTEEPADQESLIEQPTEEAPTQLKAEPAAVIPLDSEGAFTSLVYSVSLYSISSYDSIITLTGTHAKIHYDRRQIANHQYFDTVYVDFKRQTAIGYCLDTSCKDKITGVPLPFYEYDLVTPLYWKAQVDAVPGEEDVYTDSVETVYKKSGDLEVWLDILHGLPIKVKEAGKTPVYFNYLLVNNPSVSALPPPSLAS